MDVKGSAGTHSSLILTKHNPPINRLLTATSFMEIPFINDYKWEDLQQAYGSAEKAPDRLADLMCKDDDLREGAINDFLFSQICHQYTTYSATPPVVKCVIYILNNHDFEDEETLADILGFIEACTHNAKSDFLLRKEILAGETCYQRYAQHPANNVREYSEQLVHFSSGYSADGS